MSKKCLTPGTIFNSIITSDSIQMNVKIPFEIDFTEEMAKDLENKMHDFFEDLLKSFFNDKFEK